MRKQDENNTFDPQGDYDFEPIQPGTFCMQITAATKRLSKAGNDIISFRFRVIDPNSEDRGRSVFEHVPLKAGYGFRVLSRICRGVNPDMKSIQQDPEGIDVNSLESIHAHLLGQVVKCRVYHEVEEYKGERRTRERISDFAKLVEDDYDRLQSFWDRGQEEIAPPLPDDSTYWPETPSESSRGTGSQYAKEFKDDDIPF